MHQKHPQKPYLLTKQSILTILQFTPISAFLSLTSLLLTFTVQPSSPLPFLILLTPLYINTHSYALGISLIVCSAVWPACQGETFGVVRLGLIANACYLMGSSNRKEGYRMMPGRVVNQGVPILL